jgi:hypothetical protein
MMFNPFSLISCLVVHAMGGLWFAAPADGNPGTVSPLTPSAGDETVPGRIGMETTSWEEALPFDAMFGGPMGDEEAGEAEIAEGETAEGGEEAADEAGEAALDDGAQPAASTDGASVRVNQKTYSVGTPVDATLLAELERGWVSKRAMTSWRLRTRRCSNR